ncbi:MAG: hypothetical protein HYT03_03470 [Candidatus Harrisonbacteria bacterium]|nr:hypothetical protein [Candidatus Harrisonbacteria bacterium]
MDVFKTTAGKIAIPVLIVFFSWFFTSTAFALSSNISFANNERHAWSDLVGWIDFGKTGAVQVVSSHIKGWASSDVGDIALDCGTTPSGDICTGSSGNWKVRNTINGQLSGWAWSDQIGWISFCGNETNSSDSLNICPSNPTYSVTIDTDTGVFRGWAWNDVIGWISFNCNNSGVGNICSTSDYKVKTDWRGNLPTTGILTSSIFDTQVNGGVALNTVSWLGNSPIGTVVKFQIASSNISTGPWNFKGSDGSEVTYYEPSGPSVQTPIRRQDHNNVRYFRYKIFIITMNESTPRVDDVIINYSP